MRLKWPPKPLTQLSDYSDSVITSNHFYDWVLARNAAIKSLLIVNYWFATVSFRKEYTSGATAFYIVLSL